VLECNLTGSRAPRMGLFSYDERFTDVPHIPICGGIRISGPLFFSTVASLFFIGLPEVELPHIAGIVNGLPMLDATEKRFGFFEALVGLGL
jgi:hypothetical protein